MVACEGSCRLARVAITSTYSKTSMAPLLGAFSKTSVFDRSGEDTRLKLKTLLAFSKSLMRGAPGILQVTHLSVISLVAGFWMSQKSQEVSE